MFLGLGMTILSQVGERIAIGKEMEKMKEELSSADYRIKWFQNKLKAELEAHKVS